MTRLDYQATAGYLAHMYKTYIKCYISIDTIHHFSTIYYVLWQQPCQQVCLKATA